MSTSTTLTNTETQTSFGQEQVLSILIPAYNEAQTLASILDLVIRVDLIRNLQKENTLCEAAYHERQTHPSPSTE